METLEYKGVGYVMAADLARARGKGRQTVYMAIKGGRLPGVTIAGRLWVPAADADVWNPSSNGGKRPGAGRRPRRGDCPRG